MSEYFWIEKLNEKPKYKLGQNFLIDTNISRKITKLVQGQLADPIIEVGPGTGSLTSELLKDNYRIIYPLITTHPNPPVCRPTLRMVLFAYVLASQFQICMMLSLKSTTLI